jgi:ATP-binding cassette subfamily B protein
MSDLQIYRRLLLEARPYWPHIAVMFILSLLTTPFMLLTPLPLKIIVDSVIGDKPLPDVLHSILPSFATRSDTSVLAFAVILFVALALATQLRDLANLLLQTYTGERLVLGFRARVFRHVQRLSLTYHDSKGTADSLYRIQKDASSIQDIAMNGVIPFVTAGVTLVSMLFVIYRINWQLLLVGLSVSPVLFLLSRAYRPRLRKQSREVKTLESSTWSVVQETLTAMRVVKAFGQEDLHRDRFVARSVTKLWANVRLTFAQAGFGLLIAMTTAVGTGVALFVGARLVTSGALTLGELLVVTTYLGHLYSPLQSISKKAASLQLAMASAERAFTVLDRKPDVEERPNAVPLGRAVGAIEFRDVGFAYEAAHAVLSDVSFVLRPGSRLGIAGTTGAGKTTLVSLLTRFYDPTVGQILLDGRDLRDYRLADLRNQFAIVLQDAVLFSASIAENIAYSRPEASFEEIVEAARAANAHDFIVGLRDGYETKVGERGMRLSGGERQRIALARAFLKDAPVLILDEPTSSVDVNTEAGIIESMERLMVGRTTIMIAHRLSTLERCDVRIGLEHGRIVSLTDRSGEGVAALEAERRAEAAVGSNAGG